MRPCYLQHTRVGRLQACAPASRKLAHVKPAVGLRELRGTPCTQQRHGHHNQGCQANIYSSSQPERHEQDHAKATQLLGLGLPRRLPKLPGAPDAQQGFAGNLSGLAAGSLSAIKHQTGEQILQLSSGSRQLNPFTEVVWVRGPRRWLGLRKGRYMRVEQPAPWLLEVQQCLSQLQQHMAGVPRRLSEVPEQLSKAPQHLLDMRHHITVPNLLVAAAVIAALLLIVLLMQKTLWQRGKQAAPQEDPELLARKAASLDMQRNRFRRALGGEEDEAPPDMPISVASTSASTSPTLNVDQSVTDKDDFAAWDDDTQKQWKRFMKGSRSQEIDEEQWWDIDREELPPDRQVYQDFN
ncbi:hypothetical protein WJX82_003916 [Trebouxia sp. C0006]